MTENKEQEARVAANIEAAGLWLLLNETLAELEQVRALVRILLFDGADVSETEARIALKEWCMEGQEAAA